MDKIIPDKYKSKNNPFNSPLYTEEKHGVYKFKGQQKGMYVYLDTHEKESLDIGWKQLIYPDNPQQMQRNGIEYILDNFSTIRIAECVQETKIDTILSAIRTFVDGWKSGKEAYEKAKESGVFGKLAKFIAAALSTNTFFASILKPNVLQFKNGDKEIDASLKLVYILQYCLMNREWNNTYEFPYDSSQLYVSNGTDGWKHEENGWGGTSNHSFVGKMLNFFGSQIRIMSEPIWQGTSQDSQTQIQVKVNLFNNTMERAIKNYIMVHNLMPNNLYLQYGLLQQAPSYYDVHIFGNRRYPLCKANFTCNAKGLFRKIDTKNLNVDQKIGGKTLGEFFGTAHELRIPDVYELDLNFQSLLPDSFNDFLYFWYLDEQTGMNPIEGGVFYENEPADSIEQIVSYAKDNGGVLDEKIKTIEQSVQDIFMQRAEQMRQQEMLEQAQQEQNFFDQMSQKKNE